MNTFLMAARLERFFFRGICAAVLLWLLTACHPNPILVGAASTIAIPAQQDWVDYGLIFPSGDFGSWDYQLFGGFAGSAVRFGSTYFLYYQGASGYRIADDTVTWRAVGVASSSDGINFTKSVFNPILTWFPNNNGEEGAVSTGALVANPGEVLLYYGANTEETATLVNADGRLASSSDGIAFSDQGVVLDHTDSSLWGSGDELFPIIAIQDAGSWYVYYLPNGTLQSRQLGVAWGTARDNLSSSSPATSAGFPITAWGMAGAAEIAPGTYALFLTTPTRGEIEVRTVALTSPEKLSSPVHTYQFTDLDKATVLLDSGANTWFMYYRTDAGYGVKLAPAGIPDSSPPGAPPSVNTLPTSYDTVRLTWNPANDPETGIAAYKIFRDGSYLDTVKGWSFDDEGLNEKTQYGYQVSAINLHGVEGPRSAIVPATTPADTSPPMVVSVSASGPPNQVIVAFDEHVEQASAENASNYWITPGVTVLQAIVQQGEQNVVLNTTPHSSGDFQISISQIRDRAQSPNTLAASPLIKYTHIPVGDLAGAWNLDAGAGSTALDSSNHQQNGSLLYTNKPGPTWVSGINGSGLQFDGIDDQVTIPGDGLMQALTAGSYSFAAWVHPDSLPPNTTANNSSFSLLVRDYTGLYYDHDARFRATIRLTNGTETSAFSAPIPPGAWHHVAMVVDAAQQRLYLYLDGKKAIGSPVAFSGILDDLGAAPYYFGTSEPLAERYEYRMLGKMDEVRIFGRAISPQEVQALYTWTPVSAPGSTIFLPLIHN